MIINEKTGLYENYGLWYVPFWQTQKFQNLCLIVVVLLVLFLVVFWGRVYLQYRCRQKLSAWDEALADLKRLKKEHMLHPDVAKEFYIALSNIVKHYLERRFYYDTMGKTDSELIMYLQEIGADQAIIDDVGAMARGAEIIKFANAKAAQDQINHDYSRVSSLVSRTIPTKEIK